MKIPCDTFRRLSKLLPHPKAEIDLIFRTFRLENGKVIVTDRSYLAVESVEQFDGVFHILPTDEFLQQCETESQFNSVVEITPNPVLKYTTAQTTMGFTITENMGVWSDEPTDFDKWYERIIEPVKACNGQSSGHMVWDADGVAKLASSSPSGFISFEAVIDNTRPMLIRDVNDSRWAGFFLPRVKDGRHHPAATLPEWLK